MLAQVVFASKPRIETSACSVKFNPFARVCTKYVVYNAAGSAVSGCLETLDQVTSALENLIENNFCARPIPSQCVVKLNPFTQFCTKYVIYEDGGMPISDCLTDIERDVKPTLLQLSQLGMCNL